MRRLLTLMLCLTSMIASFGFLIHVRSSQALVGYTIAEHEESLVALEERLNQLRLEKEVLMRPERIQQRAHQWFKMRYSHE